MTTIPASWFVWFDYVSNEARKAQGFFGELFGWKTNDVPMPGGRYTMIVAAGGPIGGYTQPPPVNTHWLSYLLVADARATAAQVASIGGTIAKPAFAIGEVATMALVVDPLGAAFALWQPNRVDDTGDYKGTPGTWIWNELYSDSPDRSATFYKAIGGFEVETMMMGGAGPGPNRYEILKSDGKRRAGIMKLPGMPPHWMPYVQVANRDAVIEKAKKLGADLKTAETVPGIGRLAVFIDPLGAPLGILQPE
jgi:predicted enzyme related to lactoylglutathione lyase